jgi:hypothetical protein
MRRTGYPKGRKGYVVDHIVPLECGGADVPSNMQWQTVQEAKIKDRSERSADGSNGGEWHLQWPSSKECHALKITGMTSGTTRNTLRVLGKPSSELEQHFILKSCASVKVSIHEIRGRIMRYTREPESVYEITIQARE